VVAALAGHVRAHVARGGRVREVVRHSLGLFNGLPGARRWRRTLSDAALLAGNDWRLIERAAQEVLPAEAVPASARAA
jgi:tRNA-dihydrouridine synthase A